MPGPDPSSSSGHRGADEVGPTVVVLGGLGMGFAALVVVTEAMGRGHLRAAWRPSPITPVCSRTWR